MREILEQCSDPVLGRKLLDRIRKAEEYKDRTGREPAFMEVCGSHTMALARTGIKALLRGHVELISGPGCPVCVTDQKDIDAMIQFVRRRPDPLHLRRYDAGSRFKVQPHGSEGGGGGHPPGVFARRCAEDRRRKPGQGSDFSRHRL